MSQPHLLVVDDDPAMLRSTERVLASRYEVLAVRRPGDALEQAPAFAPDVAVLDIRMSDMDGFELASRLRRTCPGIDVIFMTGIVHELDAQLIRSIREKAFYFIQKPFDRDVLLTLVERCLEVRRLAALNAAHTARLEAELAEARAFQASILPPGDETIQRVTIAARHSPCEAMSGDFFDWVDAGRGRVTVMLADVSGHGVSAAMLVGIVKAAFRASRVDQFEPRLVARRIHNAIKPFDAGRFVTLFCARIARDDRSLEYVNCGHPRPLHWHGGEQRVVQELELSGPMISPAFPDMDWEPHKLEVQPGDGVLVYTDGITETRDPDDQLFGRPRLLDLVRGSPATGRALLDEVMQSLAGFAASRPSDDDRTLLTMGLEIPTGRVYPDDID